MLEAMSVGAKCLVSDIPENTIVLNDYGYTFTSMDDESLAESLKQAVSSSENPHKNDEIEYVKRNYSYDALIEAHEKVYESVAKKKKNNK